MQRRGWIGHSSEFPIEQIPKDEMDAEIEITPEMLEKDRHDLEERKRLTELAGGGSWRKIVKRTEN
jgi:hypothetical protein